MPHVVSRKIVLDLQRPWSGRELGRAVGDLLQRLAEGLSIRGVVPGHIKALVSEGEVYAAFNCTCPGEVRITPSRGWEDALLFSPLFSLSVAVVGLPGGEVVRRVDARLEVLREALTGEQHGNFPGSCGEKGTKEA